MQTYQTRLIARDALGNETVPINGPSFTVAAKSKPPQKPKPPKKPKKPKKQGSLEGGCGGGDVLSLEL